MVSPDGRWLAYDSNSSGTYEVYVRSFANSSLGQWQVSTAGGTQPTWGPGGKELFFFGRDGALMSATSPNLVLVQHWAEELKARVPVN
jgi:eukaryotic-like serine/threonine-protein kinase